MKCNVFPKFPFSLRFVRFYTGSRSAEFAKGGEFYCTDPKCHKGALKADEALVSKMKRVIVENVWGSVLKIGLTCVFLCKIDMNCCISGLFRVRLFIDMGCPSDLGKRSCCFIDLFNSDVIYVPACECQMSQFNFFVLGYLL